MTKMEVISLLNESIRCYVDHGRYYSDMHNTEAAKNSLAKAEACQNFIMTIKDWRKR